MALFANGAERGRRAEGGDKEQQRVQSAVVADPGAGQAAAASAGPAGPAAVSARPAAASAGPAASARGAVADGDGSARARAGTGSPRAGSDGRGVVIGDIDAPGTVRPGADGLSAGPARRRDGAARNGDGRGPRVTVGPGAASDARRAASALRGDVSAADVDSVPAGQFVASAASDARRAASARGVDRAARNAHGAFAVGSGADSGAIRAALRGDVRRAGNFHGRIAAVAVAGAVAAADAGTFFGACGVDRAAGNDDSSAAAATAAANARRAVGYRAAAVLIAALRGDVAAP